MDLVAINGMNMSMSYVCCLYLNKGGEGVAVLSGVTREALTNTRLVVAATTATTLVRVEVRGSLLGRVRAVGGDSLDVKSSDLGGAASGALVGLSPKEVLGTLDRVTREGNSKLNTVVDTVVGSDNFSGNTDTGDDLVGEGKKSKLDIVSKVGELSSSSVHSNGDGGEGLVQLGAERKSESLTIELSSEITAVLGVILSDELKSLDLVLVSIKEHLTLVEDISGIGAHALGAISISPLRIAEAATGLSLIPTVVVEGVGRVSPAVTSGRGVDGVSKRTGVAKILNVLASAVTGAVVGARGTLATLALVTLEALAFSGLTIADTLTGALSVLVVGTRISRGVYPGKLEGADTVGAITRVHGKTKAPVVVARAHVVIHAATVSGASIVTASGDRGHKAKRNDSLHHFIRLKSCK